MIFPNIPDFINKNILNRSKSLFIKDLEKNKKVLQAEIQDKKVLVIGGAGTIGSSFIKSLVNYHPSMLIVVDTNENGLTELTRNLRSDININLPEDYVTYPLSYSSEAFKRILDNYDFDIVANFAAHKHVRSEKDVISIAAMLENNVFSAKDLLDSLVLNPPKHFFCVSTDKAANPVNIMGGSKKLMERLIMSYSNDFKVTTARFANVAFSNGSLLDGFMYRLMHRQPISCPSDVKRFFVSPEESGQICLLACITGKTGDIFFPKLSEDQLVKFKDIAERFLRFLNLQIEYCNSENEAKIMAQEIMIAESNSKYPVYFFKTDTSGEKLFEEFYEESDHIDFDTYEELGIIKNVSLTDKENVAKSISNLKKIIASPGVSKSDIIDAMGEVLPGFNHIETGKSLDQKM